MGYSFHKEVFRNLSNWDRFSHSFPLASLYWEHWIFISPTQLWVFNSLRYLLHFIPRIQIPSEYLLTCMGFPNSSVAKESTCNAGDPGSISGSGRSSGEGIGYPLQYSWASHVDQLVKNLPEIQETWVGSLDWKVLWKRERLPTPVFWPGEFHGQYSPWGCKELDRTERLSLYLSPQCYKQ